MALLLRDIIRNLGEYKVRGNLGETIFRVAIWDDSKRLTPQGNSQGVLYIAAEAILNQFFDELNIIFVHGSQIDRIYQKVNDMLLQDYLRNSQFLHLQSAVANDSDGDTIAAICRKITGNPVWILNKNLDTMGFSGDHATRLYVEQTDVFTASMQRGSNELQARGFPYRWINRAIRHGDEVSGHVIVIYTEHSWEGDAEKRYLDAICTVLDFWPSLHEGSNRDLVDDTMLNEVLTDNITNGVQIRSKMAERNFRLHEKYYLIAIETQKGQSNDTVKRKIQLLANHNVATYAGYYVMLWGVPINKEIFRSDFRELLVYLEGANMRMAVSNPFTDEGKICGALEQCKFCFKARGIYSGRNLSFIRYEDIIFFQIFSICEQKGINLFDLCNPTLLEIYEKDKQNNTQFLKTIAALLLNDMNASVASDILHIHKNTIYNRLVTLNEKYGVDLYNTFVRTQLMLTIRIMEYLNLEDMTALTSRDLLKKYLPSREIPSN